MYNPFKSFDYEKYIHLLPRLPEDDNDVINIEKHDIYDQFWVKQEYPSVITNQFIFQEAKRLKEGVWVLIKGVPIWIPPNYYQFLQYGNAGGFPPQFRLKRLKNVYKKIEIRKNPRFLGTYNIKNRQDGDTTIAMSDALWEVISGELNNGLIGIQSKTREDAINPCWFNMKSNWNGYPQFFKNAFYSSFSSGDNIEQKLQFTQAADPKDPSDLGKNVVLQYGAAVHNFFDGKSNMRKCILDEINKWIVCRFILTFTNYKKFMMPGKHRKGIFDLISSPADTNGSHNTDAYKFWQDSDPDDLQETGSTKSRIWRMYSNPLDGIDGFYDKYGDVDPQEIYEHILKERKSVRPEDLMAEVRAYPLPILNTDRPNEEEIFGSTDSGSIWMNSRGIKARSVQIKSSPSPLVVYGNLEWPMNTPDSGIPHFRQTDLTNFDDTYARYCFSHTELKRVDLYDLSQPPDPSLIEGCIGSDPFNSVNHTKNKATQSLGAGVDWRFRDLSGSGVEQCPTGIYLARPWHKNGYHDDMIKFCLFTRSMLQYENSDGGELHDAFLQRGYEKWLLDSRDKKLIETPFGFIARKGDGPSGRGATAFVSEIISLIDDVTNVPYNKDQPYLLDFFNFWQLLDDIDIFNRDNTVYNHLTMALGQALLGRNKILFQKVRKKESVNNEIITHLLG